MSRKISMKNFDPVENAKERDRHLVAMEHQNREIKTKKIVIGIIKELIKESGNDPDKGLAVEGQTFTSLKKPFISTTIFDKAGFITKEAIVEDDGYCKMEIFEVKTKKRINELKKEGWNLVSLPKDFTVSL